MCSLTSSHSSSVGSSVCVANATTHTHTHTLLGRRSSLDPWGLSRRVPRRGGGCLAGRSPTAAGRARVRENHARPWFRATRPFPLAPCVLAWAYARGRGVLINRSSDPGLWRVQARAPYWLTPSPASYGGPGCSWLSAMHSRELQASARGALVELSRATKRIYSYVEAACRGDLELRSGLLSEDESDWLFAHSFSSIGVESTRSRRAPATRGLLG